MAEKFTSLLAACAVTLGAFAATVPASAAEPVTVVAPSDDVQRRYVSFRDLNLAMAKDEQRLVHRVRFAVKDVCALNAQIATRIDTETSKCRSSAWNGAAPQIDRAVLRAREIARNGFSTIAPVAITVSAQ